MPSNLSEWLSLLTLAVLLFTLLTIVWYSLETRGMKHEMERSRRLSVEQFSLLREDFERRYDAHVTVTDWDEAIAALTLANAGPGPAVEVGVRARVLDPSAQPTEERFYTGASGSIPVGTHVRVLLAPEVQPSDGFPESAGRRLTVEVVTMTALGRQMPAKVERPALGG